MVLECSWTMNTKKQTLLEIYEEIFGLIEFIDHASIFQKLLVIKSTANSGDLIQKIKNTS